MNAVGNTDDLYTKTPRENSSGIYYENVGLAKFYTNNWKLVT